MSLSFRPLQPFGLEVLGFNIWETWSADDTARIGKAWAEHGVLVFRRQALSEAELVRFSAEFGDADIIVREDWQSQNQPQVIQITNMKDYYGESIGGLGAGELDWHTDQSYVADPATGCLLYMVEMPKEAPRTYWSNLKLAFAALPADKRAQLQDLKVVYDYLVRQSTYDNEPKMSAVLRKRTPPVTHRLVNCHPVSGEPSLYLDPTTAARIEGWSDTDSQALLTELRAHATRPEFVYEHHWQIGDVVMWDNGFLMHRRDAFDPSGNRLLKRTTLKLPPQRHIVPQGQLAT